MTDSIANGGGCCSGSVRQGTYGNAYDVAQITVDKCGRITRVTNVPISGGGGGSSQWTGTTGNPIYYVPYVGIGSSSTPTSNLQVSGNVYVSNTVTVPNVHVTDTIDVTGSMTANAANATFFFDTFTIPYINTQYLNVSSNTTLTGNLVVATANIATLNVGFLTVNSAVVYGATTLNVYGVSNLTSVFGTTANVGTLNVWQLSNLSTLTLTNTLTTTNLFVTTANVGTLTTTNIFSNYSSIQGLPNSNVFLFSNTSGGSNVIGMDSNATVVIGLPPSSNVNYGCGYARTSKAGLVINSGGNSAYPINLSLVGLSVQGSSYNNGIDFGGGGQGCVQITHSSIGGGNGALGFNFNNSNGADGNIVERMRMTYNGISILTAANPRSTLDITGNVFASNAVTTTNVFANTSTLKGTTGQTSLNVTGNIYASNAVTTTNVFANTSTLTGTTGQTSLNVTGNIYASNAVTTTNIVTAGFTSNAVSTVFNSDTLTIPFINSTTLNVASTSNLDTVTLTGEPGITTVFASGNAYVSNALTTTNVFATRLNVSTVSLFATLTVAPTIASATTIAPTTPITFISGTSNIVTITPPIPISTTGGSLTFIPTGAFVSNTAGNIALGTTAVISRALVMTWDATTVKWYPSY
jgi:hypothetical protein